MNEYKQDCVFCNLLKNFEDKTFVADFAYGRLLVNLSQTYYDRCMYIFKNHVKDIAEVDADENKEFMLELAIISKVLKKVFNFDKIDYATLGNEVPHYHWHLIPRYRDDLNYDQKAPWPHIKKKLLKEELAKMASEIYMALINYQDKRTEIREVDKNRKILRLIIKT